MMTSIVLWLLGAMAVGAVLLVLGLRGVRLNDHPVCRQCRFDLSGCPEGTVTCPECGSGLKRPGSTRIGQRRRVPVLTAVGAAAVLLPLATFAMTVFAMITGSDVHKYLPTGVLLWEARYADAQRSGAIAAELLGRYNAKKLDASAAARAVSCALDVQENSRIPWAGSWGDLIETANLDGKVSKEDLARYYAHAAVLEFHVRPRVRIGEAIPVVIKLKEARIGSGAALMSMAYLKDAKVDGRDAHRKQGGRFSFGNGIIGQFQLNGAKSRWGAMMPAGECAFLLSTPEGASPGTVPLNLGIGVQTISQPMTTFTWPQPAEVPTTHSHECTIQLVGEGQEPVETVHPAPDVKERMERLLTPSQVMIWNGGMSNQAMQQFNVGDPPVPGAFDVYWRVGDSEWKMGSFSTGLSGGGDDDEPMINWGSAGEQRSVSHQAPPFKGSKVDIILRPSVEAALRTTDVSSIYGDEIVYKDVQVQRQDSGRTVISGGSIWQWFFGR